LDTFGDEELDHVVGDGSTSDEVLLDGMWNLETLEDWDGVSNTISGIANKTGGSTVGVEGENGLDSNVDSLAIESLEHERGHLFSVVFWVSWGLGEHDLMLSWINSKLIGEAVLPDLLHIIPRSDNTGLNWVGKLEDTSHLLCLITNVLGLGFNTNHLLVGSWDSNNGWELNARLIFSGETSFDHTGSVIDNNTLLF
jgi:hypothetical protein